MPAHAVASYHYSKFPWLGTIFHISTPESQHALRDCKNYFFTFTGFKETFWKAFNSFLGGVMLRTLSCT